jgi:hypothetical protein
MSGDRNPDGAIKTKQVHTPMTHHKLKSSEDRRRIMRTIIGIFQSGKTSAATKAIFSTMSFLSKPI